MLIEIIRILFPKTYNYIFRLGVNHGIHEERTRATKDRDSIRRLSQEQWIDKQVIIVSNEWVDPFIGTVIGLEDFGRNEAHLVVKSAITDEIVISFGKVVPFSVENLDALLKMTPWVRWEILTGQKITRDEPIFSNLKTFDQFMDELF